jgi:hypothetical protein
MVAAQAIVLSAVADTVRGIGRTRIVARWSARSAAPARSHRQPQQTEQHDSHNRDLQCRRGHECHSSECQEIRDIVRRRSDLRRPLFVVKYGDSVH